MTLETEFELNPHGKRGLEVVIRWRGRTLRYHIAPNDEGHPSLRMPIIAGTVRHGWTAARIADTAEVLEAAFEEWKRLYAEAPKTEESEKKEG